MSVVNVVSVAATVPINPPGSTPLTRVQIWEGLRRKIRTPYLFVPYIKDCTVLKDENGVIHRRVVLVENGEAVTEVCTEHAPNRVHFALHDGSEIQNIISEGQDGELYWTSTFAWKLGEGLERDGEKFKQEEAKDQKVRLPWANVLNTLTPS
jgi:hypothetical protein